jgi:hypothetical protein
MGMVNQKRRFRYVLNNPLQMCNSSHDLAPYDLAFFLPAALSSASEVTYEFVKIRGIFLLPIRVYLCSSVVRPFSFRQTLHFTSTATNAKMGEQQLTRFE